MVEPTLLSNEQLDAFLTDGYVVLRPAELDAADHDHLRNRAIDLYRIAEATESPRAHLEILGDNLRAQIPELEQLLADPVIDGALTSVLGPDYMIHPHSYCHRSSERDQPFHQDGNLPWNERGHYRTHRPDWAMLFYYPQAVDETNGPTEVVPGSQYWTVDHERGSEGEPESGGWHPGDRIDRSIDDRALGPTDGRQTTNIDLERRDQILRRGLENGLGVPDLPCRFLHLPAGSAVLAHYDLIHRGSRTAGALDPRFMFKFYFARVRRPEPTAGFSAPSADPPSAAIKPVVDANRRWLAGLGTGSTDTDSRIDANSRTDADDRALDRERWSQDLGSDREDLRVAAAYGLGRAAASDDQRALEALTAALHGPTEAQRRAAGLGLRQAGRTGVPALLRGLDSASAPVRRPSVAALATLAAAAQPEAVHAVSRAVATDPDILVRSNAAYSLGQMARLPELDPTPLAEVFLGRLAPGAEPDNATGAGFSRSTVRQSAAYGLAQVLANHRLADQQLEQIAAALPDEPDRYVQGLLVEGLARAGHIGPTAQRFLIDFLTARRWNA